MTEPVAAPPVTAVVINYNGGRRVSACVEALFRSRVSPKAVIVVDNASTDGSREHLSETCPAIELVSLPENRGPSAARNAGLAHAATNLVLLVDADVYVAEDALGELLRARLETGAAVIVPRVVLHPGRDVIQCDGGGAHFVGTLALRNGYRMLEDAREGARERVGAVISACLLVDRQRAIDAGGFDELYFIYLEDLEFGLRMRALGYELVCEPRAVVFHDRGDATPDLSFRGGRYPPQHAYLTHRNRWLTLLIHDRASTLWLLAPALVVYEAASVAFFASRGWLPVWLEVWSSIWRERGEISRRRARLRRVRVRRDVDLFEGGSLPLAPGVLQSPVARQGVALLSAVLDLYWRAAARLLRALPERLR